MVNYMEWFVVMWIIFVGEEINFSRLEVIDLILIKKKFEISKEDVSVFKYLGLNISQR